MSLLGCGEKVMGEPIERVVSNGGDVSGVVRKGYRE